MDEMLLGTGSSVHDLHGPGSSLILVLWKSILGPIESIVASIQSGQHIISIGHAAALGLFFPGALEEDHVSSEDLHQRVSVEGRLGPRSGNVVTILVASDQHVSPFWILASHGLGEVNLVPEISSVLLHVNLEVVVQHVHLLHDTGEVAHLAGHISLEVFEVHQEFFEILFCWLQKPLGSFPLVTVVPQVLPGTKVQVGTLEWVLGRSWGWQRLEGVVVVDGEGQSVGVLVQQSEDGVRGLQEAGVVLLHATLHGLLQGDLEVYHVALAPAGGHGVGDHHVLVHLLHHGISGGADRHSGEGKKSQHIARG